MLVLLLAVLTFLSIPVKVGAISAASFRAYQDHQFQYDAYRSRLSDFRIALNQYKQFRSLSSQQDAINTSRHLLAARAVSAKAYLSYLNEMLNENPSIGASELSIYRATIASQGNFLEQQAALAPSIASLDDAQRNSEFFISNYENLQAGYRQIIVGLELGYLNYFAERYADAIAQAQSLVTLAKTQSSPEKIAILDRWLLSLSNKYTLYQQKAESIKAAIPTISRSLTQQDRTFLQVQSMVAQARADLLEGASYLKELETALMYE